jgi:hypothetical protein
MVIFARDMHAKVTSYHPDFDLTLDQYRSHLANGPGSPQSV